MNPKVEDFNFYKKTLNFPFNSFVFMLKTKNLFEMCSTAHCFATLITQTFQQRHLVT